MSGRCDVGQKGLFLVFHVQRNLVRLLGVMLLPAFATFVHAVVMMSSTGRERSDVTRVHDVITTFRERHNLHTCLHLESTIASLLVTSNWSVLGHIHQDFGVLPRPQTSTRPTKNETERRPNVVIWYSVSL